MAADSAVTMAEARHQRLAAQILVDRLIRGHKRQFIWRMPALLAGIPRAVAQRRWPDQAGARHRTGAATEMAGQAAVVGKSHRFSQRLLRPAAESGA